MTSAEVINSTRPWIDHWLDGRLVVSLVFSSSEPDRVQIVVATPVTHPGQSTEFTDAEEFTVVWDE